MFNQSFKLLFVCLTAVTIASAASTGEDGRIVGGYKIPIQKAPYLVQLRDKRGHFCGGTLVHTRVVITAAHCLDGIKASDITVVGGATLTTEKGVSSQVIHALIPQEYEIVVKDMDIALLLLKSDLSGENIKTIPLRSKPLETGAKLQVSGWGRTVERGEYPIELSTVEIPIIPWLDCKHAHDLIKLKVTRSMICGSVPGKRDACTGDSGGSAVHKGELAGVVSWGIGCGDESFPGVYTDIAYSQGFIKAAEGVFREKFGLKGNIFPK